MKNSLAVSRDILIIILILLFYIGWMFEYFFLHFLSVSMLSINYQIYSFYFYSINVLLYVLALAPLWLWIFLLIILAIVAVFFQYLILRHRAILTNITRFIPLPFFLITFILSWLIGGFFLAQAAALKATMPITNGYASVTIFEFKKTGSLAEANSQVRDNIVECTTRESTHIRRICNGNLERRFHLIAKTTDYYIVYYNPKGSDEITPPGSVYYIPKDDVSTAVTFSSYHYSVRR